MAADDNKKTTSYRISQYLCNWLTRETEKPSKILLSDFDQIKKNILRCDVLLVAGRSRCGRVISYLTKSIWSHAAICIGHYQDIQNPRLCSLIDQHYNGPKDQPLLIESMMGKGVIVTPLTRYQFHHVRLCRPRGLPTQAAQRVMNYVIEQLGVQYDLEQILDLARFFFPWSLWPRRWRSSLFAHNVGPPTRLTCSLLLIEAFSKVRFPVLPLIKQDKELFELVQRHPRLYTPNDFDYSPFFDILKYPIFDLTNQETYQKLPWSKLGVAASDEREIVNLHNKNKMMRSMR